MLATVAKKAVPDPPSDAYREATERWQQAHDAYVALTGKIDGLRLAISLNNNPSHASSDRTAGVRKFAEPYLDLARRRPEQAAQQLLQAEREEQDLRPRHIAARNQWQAARQGEADRIAKQLQPAQRDAVRQIAIALEKLSIAIFAEREVREELARQAPLPTSSFLPDCSSGLACGALADWNSNASEWARRIRQLKILDG